MNSSGKIILLQNVVFLGNQTAMVDSKHFHDRPCLIVGETETEIFVLPLSTHLGYNEQIPNYPILGKNIICENNYDFKECSYIKLGNLFKKNLCYYPICGSLEIKEYREILKAIRQNIQVLKKKELNGQFYREYEPYLNEQLKILKRSKNETKKRQRG